MRIQIRYLCWTRQVEDPDGKLDYWILVSWLKTEFFSALSIYNPLFKVGAGPFSPVVFCSTLEDGNNEFGSYNHPGHGSVPETRNFYLVIRFWSELWFSISLFVISQFLEFKKKKQFWSARYIYIFFSFHQIHPRVSFIIKLPFFTHTFSTQSAW